VFFWLVIKRVKKFRCNKQLSRVCLWCSDCIDEFWSFTEPYQLNSRNWETSMQKMNFEGTDRQTNYKPSSSWQNGKCVFGFIAISFFVVEIIELLQKEETFANLSKIAKVWRHEKFIPAKNCNSLFFVFPEYFKGRNFRGRNFSLQKKWFCESFFSKWQFAITTFDFWL